MISERDQFELITRINKSFMNAIPKKSIWGIYPLFMETKSTMFYLISIDLPRPSGVKKTYEC